MTSPPLSPEWSAQAWALRLLGEVTARRDPPEDADGHYCDALALAEELGMRPLVAHCHLGLGKREQARDHLATATPMYREMDMAFWLEPAEAELRQCNDGTKGRTGA